MGKDKGQERSKGQRRSARISALEQKAKELKKQKKAAVDTTSASTSNSSSPSAAAKRRGLKRKSLQDVVVNSVSTPTPQILIVDSRDSLMSDETENQKHEDASVKSDHPPNMSSSQRMPKKPTLEFVLDILQRRDTYEIFAQPVDPEEVAGYYNIIKEPMDFGTMRAKLQEGMYTSLEQFERDVFLVSSNAMKFNSSTTVFYTEARAISELAQRVFRALRSEPENFELEYSRTRKFAGKKLQDEAGSSHTNPAKSGGVKDGTSLKDKKTARTNHASSRPHPYLEPKNKEVLSVSRDGRCRNPPVTEKRMTYMPRTSFHNEKESIVSAVCNAPKLLNLVTDAGSRYIESLKEFVKDLGPTAQMVAYKKLTKRPIGASNFLSLTRNTSDMTSASQLPELSLPQGPAFPDRVDHVQMKQTSISNLPGSYKGKMVCTDEGTSVCNAFEGVMFPNHSGIRGQRAYTRNGVPFKHTFLRDKGVNIGTRMEVTGSSQQKMNGSSSQQKTNGTGENMDLLMATLMQISAVQDRNASTTSGSNFPHAGVEDFHAVQRSQYIPESQSWLLNNYSEQMCFPDQTAKLSGMNEAASFHGFGFHYPIGEGPSIAAATPASASTPGLAPAPALAFAPASAPVLALTPAPAPAPAPPSTLPLDHNYGVKFSHQLQPLEWNQPMVWGAQPMSDLPMMPTQVKDPILSGHQHGFMLQQQQSQVAPTQEMPLFGTMSFLEEANMQGERVDTSANFFWDNQQPSLMDNNQLLDLALQL